MSEKDLKELAKFEPLLISLLEPKISEQEARILALLFKNGGYFTLNAISGLLDIAQPTVSIRVSELTAKGFVKKNEELMPIVLVLQIDNQTLLRSLNEKKNVLSNSISFLKKSENIIDQKRLVPYLEKAFKALFPLNKLTGRMLAHLYNNGIMSRNELYSKLYPRDKLTKNIESKLDQLLLYQNEYIQPLYKKYQKNETYFFPRLPLNQLLVARSSYLNELYQYYNKLIQELANYLKQDYDSFLPIQILQFPSDLRQRIDICLKKYNTIKIFYNNAFPLHYKKNGSLLDLIINSPEFKDYHKIKILRGNETRLEVPSKKVKVDERKLDMQVEEDFKKRDFVLFENHGCIVIPPRATNYPYYNISPRFIKKISSIFDYHWSS